MLCGRLKYVPHSTNMQIHRLSGLPSRCFFLPMCRRPVVFMRLSRVGFRVRPFAKLRHIGRSPSSANTVDDKSERSPVKQESLERNDRFPQISPLLDLSEHRVSVRFAGQHPSNLVQQFRRPDRLRKKPKVITSPPGINEQIFNLCLSR
jgi:hypothetical protein